MTIVNEYTSAAVSDRGLNASRPQNEDSYVELADIGLFAVADGVGGAQAGEVASQMAVEILTEAFSNMTPDTDPEVMMRAALERANEAIFQMSRDLPQLSSMATTIVALHVANDIATIAHVGDSRVYRIDPNGRIFRETDDHSVVEEEVRAGRMTPEQALTHPSRNVISRALGADDTVEPDIRMVIVHPGTKFLLCSDGITRHIDDSELQGLLGTAKDPTAVCTELKDLCFERGAEDNLTAVIVSFPGGAADADSDDDLIEEETIAGVRENVVEPAALDEILATSDRNDGLGLLELGVADEHPSDAALSATTVNGIDVNPQDTAADDDEAYLLQETEPNYEGEADAEADYVPATNLVAEAEENTADPEPKPRPAAYSIYPDDAETAPRKGGSVLGWLIAGLVIGIVSGLAAGYYIVQANIPRTPVPVLSEQKSNNVPLTSFEETRRLVDADPVKFLNANAATPQEAGDFFWLGRALLLTGKPVEAKRALEEARKRLAGVADPSNVKTMSNEIAMAMIIASDPASAEAFAKEVAAASAPPSANTNVNSAAPVR